MSNTPPVRPGWKTSELWLAAVVVGAILESGILETGSTLERALGLVAIVLTALGYTVARTKAKTPRKPEAGHALLGLLASLAACALIVGAAGHLWSCSGTKATTADVGTCSAAQAGPLVDDVQQLIADNTDEAGHVDWQRVEDGLRARLLRYGREVVTCAVRRAIDRMLATPTLVRVDRAELERGWERLRTGVLSGHEAMRRFGNVER